MFQNCVPIRSYYLLGEEEEEEGEDRATGTGTAGKRAGQTSEDR